jgi:hypothetical protein
VRDAALLAESEKILAKVGAEFSPEALMHELSVGDQQLVEIAKALARDSRVLILDEPTSSLSKKETDRLFALLRELRGQGRTLLYISHRMEEIFSLSDRITVLRDGSSVASGKIAEFTEAKLISHMVDRELGSLYPVRPAPKLGTLENRVCDGVSTLEDLAAGALDAWRAEYVNTDGSLTPDTQANHVRALAFDLLPTELRAPVAAQLVELIREVGTHLGTGFLATPHLLPVLADAGHLDVAYELLLQDTEPSWLVMIDRGATTMWERWNGVNAHGVPHESLNHYSKGAVVSFLHRYVAGIELPDDDAAPAYRRFRIRPRPGGGLTSASAAHDSPYGRIESAWEITGSFFDLRIRVPAGTQAEVVLPDGRTRTAGPGAHRYSCQVGSTERTEAIVR